jgi:hypothetical protein
VSPTSGSLYGGNEIVVTGTGFGSDPSFIHVVLHRVEDASEQLVTCVATSVTPTEIRCLIDMAAYLTDHTRAVVDVQVLSTAGDTTTGELATDWSDIDWLCRLVGGVCMCMRFVYVFVYVIVYVIVYVWTNCFRAASDHLAGNALEWT